MLTISQVARYAGVTTRTIRHYHAIGLLPEPERSESDYRLYDAQAVVDLRRIRTLTEAGVPLRRVKELLDADEDAFRAALVAVAADLDARIAALTETRAQLGALEAGEDPFLPSGAAEIRRRMRALGVSERTLEYEREGWILAAALYPGVAEQWLATQLALADDAEWDELTVLTDQAADWDPDDPRLPDLARRSAALLLRTLPAGLRPDPGADPAIPQEWQTGDPVAFDLMARRGAEGSPAWARMNDLVQVELARQSGSTGVTAEPPSSPEPHHAG